MSFPSRWYVFHPTLGNPDAPKWSMQDANMTGFVMRIAANQIVSKDDPEKFQFSEIKKRLYDVRQKFPNTHWQLEIFTGTYVPNSWKTAGVKTQRFRYKTGGTREMLVPWDKKAQSFYARLMNAAGTEFGRDETLDLIHVTFPQAYSPEMHMPPELIRASGYWTKIVESYGYGISAVEAAFPLTPVCLNLFNLGMGVDGKKGLKTTEAIARAALVANPKLFFQVNSWQSGAQWGGYDLYRLLLKLSGEGANCGLEENQPKMAMPGGAGYLSAVRAQYAIIYPDSMKQANGKFPPPENPEQTYETFNPEKA